MLLAILGSMTDRLDWFLQQDTQASLPRAGEGEWTVLWEQARLDFEHPDTDTQGLGRYCALSRPENRPIVLGRSTWDLSIGDHRPGLSATLRSDPPDATYVRAGDDDGFEPLVRFREFYGVKPDSLELSEDFRLFHNLWDNGRGELFLIEDDGSVTLVAEVAPDKVRVKTRLLRQYQAARQMDLILFIESDRWTPTRPAGAENFKDTKFADGSVRAEMWIGETPINGRYYCRFQGKKLLLAPPIERSGIWPYEAKDDHYPEFLIGVDADGEPVRYSCNPDNLANYFGANPDAPHYLTPVFFKREVLQRYYEQPELYTVEDGHLLCAGLWSLRMDNDDRDHVMVFLGDLGRDLPPRERDHWVPFCVSAGRKMSDTAWRRGFLAEFADATSPDIVFRERYERLAKAWKEKFGWDLLRPPNPGDEHILQRVRLPLNLSQPEFEGQLMNLARLLVDFPNVSELKQRTTADTSNMQSISTLEAWLTQEGYPEVRRDIALLRTLQDLRSKGAAHRKGSDFSKVVQKALGEVTNQQAISALLQQGNQMLQDLGTFFNLVDD